MRLLSIVSSSFEVQLQALAQQLAASAVPVLRDEQGTLHVKPTLLVAPAACYNHKTCPEPITRDGSDIPPENVKRLRVLTHPGKALSSRQFTQQP